MCNWTFGLQIHQTTYGRLILVLASKIIHESVMTAQRESINLTVSPLYGPGSIPRVFQGLLPDWARFAKPSWVAENGSTPANGTIRPLDIEEEGRIPTMDRQPDFTSLKARIAHLVKRPDLQSMDCRFESCLRGCFLFGPWGLLLQIVSMGLDHPWISVTFTPQLSKIQPSHALFHSALNCCTLCHQHIGFLYSGI